MLSIGRSDESQLLDSIIKESNDTWNHNRFKKGTEVSTPLGKGIIVDIDIPFSRAWRWGVTLHGDNKPKYFFDKEVEELK